MLQRFALCLLITSLKLNSADDEFNIQQKIQTTTSKLYNNITLAAKRCLVSLPFDCLIITRQVTGAPYSEISENLIRKNTSLTKIFKVHFIETFLRAEMIYNLFPFVSRGTKECFPRFSELYPLAPSIAAATAIAIGDIVTANPFERVKVCYIRKLPIPFYSSDKFDFSEFAKSRKWLFTGGSVTFLSSFVHVGTFLTLNHHLKHWLFNKENALTFYESCLIGPIISTAQATISFPLLTFRAKLHAEQLEVLSRGIISISAPQYFYQLYQTNMLPGLFYGWRARAARGTIMAMLDTYWLNQTAK